MGIEQHLMRLQQIGPHQKCPAVRQLNVGDLQLDPLTADIGPVFAPIKLKGFTRLEHKRHEDTPVGRVIRALAFAFPFTNEGRNTLVGTVISQLHQIGVHQLRRPALFA